MTTIWKTVVCQDELDHGIVVPSDAELLYAREQHNEVCIWFRCEPSRPQERRRIKVVGTGHSDCPDGGRYLGSAHLNNGQLVFHVFELDDKRAPAA